ncbi:hypothetical protein BFW87_24640 [Pseudomonas fluorescens]|uniref:Uncharacterized protein n=1 Tax=Pseudomonas fluorescens TaxID=294 RepID=A0A1T2Y2S7_PSEFL|nr:hypothetical protein [Pseudomonas fluorescens]OPA86447.1 hypothetical protein BFW87_24640 [Pseudomonas fluorescens]
MIKPTSKLQAFLLLFVYCFLVFMVGSVVGLFLKAVIVYVRIDVWAFGWKDVSGVVAGVLIYTGFTTVGVWVLSRLEKRNKRQSAEADNGGKDNGK